VLDVSKVDRTAAAQAGTVLADLSACLEPHGLILGHDPWTVPIATVGGTISTNSLGYRGGKYGGMADQVLGIEAVMADGSVVRTRPVARSSSGPRLHQLFAGAEGQFGVITAATLRVFPVPERRELVALNLPSFAHGFRVALDLHALGLSPAVLDFGAPPGEPGRMYLGFEGFTEEVEAQVARARRIWQAHAAEQADQDEADEWWEDRHVSRDRLMGWRSAERHDPAPGTMGSAVFDYLHMALPASRVLAYIQQAEAMFARRGVSLREWGLWHGPELLSTVLYRRTDTPDDLAEATLAVDDVLRLAQDMGGSMEYVHGVGVRYAHLMEREHGSGLRVLRAVKRALDPDGIFNPGKLGL
jgi:FAD/FMN-containing dehydrogenase